MIRMSLQPYARSRHYASSRKTNSLKPFIAWKYGAIELGLLTDLSDVICDLTATGKTLQEHALMILDRVFESTAHLIANPVV